jgi:hypothetical protein
MISRLNSCSLRRPKYADADGGRSNHRPTRKKWQGILPSLSFQFLIQKIARSDTETANSFGASPFSTQRQNFRSAVTTKC